MNVGEFKSGDCSGCELCANICPQTSISFQLDNMGFKRPFVDAQSCLNCGLCVKKCVINIPAHSYLPISTYASVRSERSKVSMSSSGGVFAAISEKVLTLNNWVVSGCELDDSQSAKHKLAYNIESLPPLYGSKYVQSEMGEIYKSIENELKLGKNVLFSGTPCQVAAVQRYTKNHPNLYTIEVICHGVANAKMFASFLDMYKREQIKHFYFRDKSQGWSFNSKIIYKNGTQKKINHRLSSYMTYFLQGETYRDSCYQCPYAQEKRCADITIGDYWGVLKTRPDLNDVIDVERGVSCLLVNSKKGEGLVSMADLEIYEVDYKAIKEGNGPLNEPSRYTSKREEILKVWARKCDWRDVHLFWKKKDLRLTFILWSFVPTALQHKIRVVLGKR